MLSILTGLFSSLAVSPASPAQKLRYCACDTQEPFYDHSYLSIGGSLDELCASCKSPRKERVAQRKDTPSPTPVSGTPQAQPPKVRPSKTAAKRCLNEKLEASFSSLPAPPVLICSNGNVAAFENGQILRPYQAVDVQRMYDRERLGKSTLLAYDMGLGKTVTASALVCSNRTPAFTDFPTTLVIAPSIGILQHWQGELTKFAPKLRVVLYHKDGRKHDPRLPDIALLTLSELRNQYAAYIDENTTDSEKYPLYSGTFHRVIIGKFLYEAHTIRNPESASAKACWALKKSHGLCLTGTPAQNKLMDLHSLLKFLEVASEGLNDLTTFNARVTAPYEGGDFERPMELIVRVLSECMIYRPKNPRLVRLPKLHASVVVAVELTPAEREVYLYMKSDHRFKSQWAKTVRLRQAADHPMLLTTALHRGDIGPKPDDTSDQMRAALDESRADANKTIAQDSPLPIGKLPPSLQKHAAIFKPGYLSSKFIALLGILERIPDGQKVIIFSHFLTNLDLLAEILPRASYARYDGRMGPSERVAALDQIRNEKKCTILLLSIMAGGTGLDIPACNHVVLMEPWWNPYVEEQAISRVHRIGQSRDVRVYRLLVKDSIEDSIVKTQDAKKEIIGGLLSLCEVPDVDEMKKWLA